MWDECELQIAVFTWVISCRYDKMKNWYESFWKSWASLWNALTAVLSPIFMSLPRVPLVCFQIWRLMVKKIGQLLYTNRVILIGIWWTQVYCAKAKMLHNTSVLICPLDSCVVKLWKDKFGTNSWFHSNLGEIPP